MSPNKVPDQASHKTGWEARKIEGRWRVGMRGNLDTPHDAVLTVNQMASDDLEAQRIAEWVAGQFNTAVGLSGEPLGNIEDGR